MSRSRRNFLKFISLGLIPAQAATLSGCTHQKFYNPDQNILLGGGRFKKNDELQHVLAVVNLQQKTKELVDCDFLAHGILIDPSNKKRLIMFEKNAVNAAEVNLNSHTVTKKISATEDKHFSGHGAFSPSGDILFCTETHLEHQRGSVTIRDGKNFKVLGEFSSYGENPHECQLIDKGSTLVVTNTGGDKDTGTQPCVVYIDVKSQKLIERVTLSNQQLNVGHIAINKNGSLIVASAPKKGLDASHPGGVSIRNGQQAMLSMQQPEMVINRITGEALSVAIDETHNIAAVTHPDSNMLTFWSIDKRELRKALSVPNPRGITLSIDEKSFIVSYDENTSVILINTRDLTADKDSIMQPSYISGAHIYNWSKTLFEIMPADVYS